MNKIKILNENLSNKIAAGEVVERISNVVKELVENSLDAGAKNIKIELLNSGFKMIKITDDGSGMSREDALNCFQRHATSKIYAEDDLFFISSLGFRGEALPSIASVSKITLTTSSGDIGTKIEIHGGNLIKEESSDSRVGTSIEVRDLFYNTPARLKYLKSEQSELALTVQFIEKLSLSHPQVSFELLNNENQIIKTSGTDNLLKTIHEIYGLSVSKNMFLLTGENDDYEVHGYISKPSLTKSTRNYITTIVNGRVIKNLNLNRVINDAYHTYKPDGKFPIIVLKIQTDPTLVDVNIHPTKQDIKFSKTTSIEELIFNSIKETLNKELLIPVIEKTYNQSHEPELTSYDNVLKRNEPSLLSDDSSAQQELNLTYTTQKLKLYPAGLVFGTYIVAQNEEGMYLIDQHAAQERINYEKIEEEMNSNIRSVTSILIPITVELTPSDYIKLNENKSIIEDLGFKAEDFGINTITIKEHPTWLLKGFEEETTLEIIELVINLTKDFSLSKFRDSVAASAACKRSVKGNTNITILEMESLLEELFKCTNPYSCPHGRPTIITFTKYELEKMFKRVMN